MFLEICKPAAFQHVAGSFARYSIASDSDSKAA